MADIKQAIEYAKQNPDSVFATELRKRIESGRMNNELKSAGLNNFIQTQKPSLASSIVNDPIKTLVIKPALRFGQAIGSVIAPSLGISQEAIEKAQQEDVTIPSFTGDMTVEGQKGGVAGAKQITGDAFKSASYLYGGGGLAKTLTSGIKGQIARGGSQGAITGSISGGTYGFGESLSQGNDAKTVIEDTLLGAGVGTLTGLTLGLGLSGASVLASKTNNLLKTAKSKTSDIVSNLTAPDVPESVKVSLNPQVALKGTGQDVTVSVGGKLKKLSDLTLSDNSKLQSSTQKSVNTFTKQAEKFAKDRSVAGGSPVEIVGNRTDTALQFADKKRQSIGQKMGAIEQKYAQEVVPIKDETFKSFVNIVDLANDPKYGVKGENASVVQKLVEDFDSLNSNGLTIEERNKFIRSWQTYLRDAKDAFGNFKENNTVNTQIERAINTIKNETVDAVSMKDKLYRGLRQKYAQYIKLQEIGDMLLGKEGALGQRIKGSATVKRAIQSNSDAGARQFLTALKEITGYDAIKDGDLALIAMENAGDYQGLSLLNIIKEGSEGVKNKAIKMLEDRIIGTPKQRVDRFIQKK
jgi:hypothetical protein